MYSFQDEHHKVLQKKMLKLKNKNEPKPSLKRWVFSRFWTFTDLIPWSHDLRDLLGLYGWRCSLTCSMLSFISPNQGLKVDSRTCEDLVKSFTAAFWTINNYFQLKARHTNQGFDIQSESWVGSYPKVPDRRFNRRKNGTTFLSFIIVLHLSSTLGSLLFLIYLLPLQHILSSFKDISYHFYADDIQFSISFKLWDVCKLQIFHRCSDSFKCWMVNNFLQINKEKTEVLVYSPDRFVSKVLETPEREERICDLRAQEMENSNNWLSFLGINPKEYRKKTLDPPPRRCRTGQ